ncbi:MAG: YcjF family protein [Limisphaerales bacterium]
MTPVEQESVLTLVLMAAFADGAKHDAERAELKRIAESLPHADVQPAALYQRVLLKQVTPAQAAAPLQSPELRQLAYEMAVCVCDADGAQTDAEKAFLAGLRRELKLEEKAAAAVDSAAEALAVEPLAGTAMPPALAQASAVDAQVDKLVLNHAILNGALELLPASLATMAIVPLQMKMVYRVGKSYGQELGRGHIKELLAAAGVGLTSQVLEGYARKLLGGLLGKVGGGMLKTAGKQAASSVMSFATTWALGKLAQQYYAGGRRLSAIELRSTFASLTEQARTLHSRYGGEIHQKAGSVNVSQLLPLIRGQ